MYGCQVRICELHLSVTEDKQRLILCETEIQVSKWNQLPTIVGFLTKQSPIQTLQYGAALEPYEGHVAAFPLADGLATVLGRRDE